VEIVHNINAINSKKQFGIVTNNLKKCTEKLSSGYQINRAADNAAGLGISEKMRCQIRGLNKASRNVQDGISVCQVADGALSEMSSMIHRIYELSVQSANDTNTDADRDAIQAEVDEIIDEIDRVSETTTFNTEKLFDTKYKIILDENGRRIQKVRQEIENSLKVTGTAISGTIYQIGIGADNKLFVNNNEVPNKIVDKSLRNFSYDGLNFSFRTNSATLDRDVVTALNSLQYDAATQEFTFKSSILIKDKYIPLEDGYWIQAGSLPNQGVALRFEPVNATILGLKGLKVSSYAGAQTGIEATEYALETLSAMRSKIGATQNRLEYAMKNLTNTSENVSASESRLRDTDIAEEMVKYAKESILAQTGQAMITQANTMPEGVLKLL